MTEAEPVPPPPLSWWAQAWRLGVVALLSLVVWVFTVGPQLDAAVEPALPTMVWIVLLDPVLGLLAFVAVLFRRRAPVAVAVATSVLSIGSATAAGPALLAICSVATRRRVAEIALVTPVTIACGWLFEVVYPGTDDLSWWVAALFGVLFTAVVVAVGWSVGADRERLRTLQDRAETAEREQQARVAAARAAERTRIAREMHDVLAHRISLVSMHAGALTFRDDLPRERQVEVARTIEENAHLALRDLRDVLGVLRAEDPTAAAGPERPQPGMADLPRLVEEARAAGMRVSLDDTSGGAVATTAGRTVYRVVQEALTNARKHASGCPVEVRIGGTPGEALDVTVTNPLPVGRGLDPTTGGLPGSGLGLLGLHERVDLLGGTLTSGEVAGRFVVRASLPWDA